jgi:TonB-dependent starch-binding outer membrane protein SusC
MEKKLKLIIPWSNSPGLRKMLLCMKLTLVISLVAVLQTWAAVSYSQTTTLSISLKNATVQTVLQQVEDQSEFYFLYSRSIIDVDRTVDVQLKDAKITEVLNALFNGTDVAYKVDGRQIVLSKKSESSAFEMQQQKSVSGKVTDSSGASLPGVSVVVKGTTAGVITDMDGKYSLSKVPENATLQFSFVGMKTQEIIVGSKTKIDVILADEAIGIEEVVAIGYGTMKKSDLTGAVISADIKSFKESANTNILQALKGAVTGLNVSQTTGAGQDPSISMRGTRSISGSQQPLIVLDGIIYRGSLNDISPNDIEAIDILKDASSAAIYGSEAANGVIIVTTKSGSGDGKPIISFSSSYTSQSAVKVLHPSNFEQFVKKNTDADWQNNMLAPDYTQPNPAYVNTHFQSNAAKEGWDNKLNTDWWGLSTVKNPNIQNYNLSIRAKTKHISYFVSGDFMDQQNLLINDKYKRNSLRMNIDNVVTDWLTIGVKTFLTLSDFSGASPDLRQIHILAPIAKPFDDKGNIITEPYWGGNLSPLLRPKMDDLETRMNLEGNFYADIKIPWVKGLSYKFSSSLKNIGYKHYFFNPWGSNHKSDGYKYNSAEQDWTIDNIISYKKVFKDIHNVDVTLVYGREERSQEETYAGASVFGNSILGYNSLEAGDAIKRTVSSGAWKESSLYSMARVYYGFKNKYMFTGTVRRDGFSGFGANSKFGVFPSVALAWVASNENFIKEKFAWVNNLKLRASYGVNGNRTLSRYQTLSPVYSGNSYLYGDGGAPVLSQWVGGLSNPDLKWERTTGLNLGIDYSLLSSKIFGSIEYYNTRTNDLLYNINIPDVNGFSSVATNIGELKNHGFEFTVTGAAIKKNDFKWNVTANFSLNRNKVATILGRDDNKDGKEDDLVSSNIFIGQPLGVWYDYEKIGMWQLADEKANKIPAGFYPGTWKIADLNNDGKYTADADRKILGYTDPSYRVGIQNRFEYKNFELMIFINSVQGGKKYYYGNIDIQDGGWTGGGDNMYSYANPGWDWWTPSNPNAIYPRLTGGATWKPTLYMQRNFVRLQDVSLSYNFNNALLKKANIKNLKLYVSGKNLATWTKWRGWDPEAGIGYQTDAMPVMKSYTAGLNIEF